MSDASAVVDVIGVVVIVGAATAFLVSRFVDRRRPGGGEVVVGAGLQRGLDKARRRRRR